MSRNNTLGVIGGVLIALSVFFSGNTANFDLDRLSGGTTIVLFAAGILVAVFLLLRNRTWASYAAIAATTIAIIAIVDGGFALALGFILLIVGVILALIGTVVGKK